jgi:ABC-type amino acid transport substrate-binding protein
VSQSQAQGDRLTLLNASDKPRRMHIHLLLLTALLTIFAPLAEAEKVTVVTRTVEPFSFEKDGRRVGYAMELWEQVAREAGFEYDVQTAATAAEMIDALAAKKAEIGVGALSVTAKREEIIDFSQPYYETGLQVLVDRAGGGFFSSMRQLLGNLFNWQLLGMFSLLLVAIFVISHLVWRYEHKVNESMWPADYKQGIWESFWWTISTLLVGGVDNKGPVGVGGRIVAIVWMLLSILLVSLLTASFTTTLTVNTLKGDINGPSDLPGRRVATIQGSTSEAWLNAKAAKVQAFANVAECIAALKERKVEAVVYDAPMLQYAIQQMGDEKLQMVGPIFDQQNYAFALQQDSPLRKRINRALLTLQERGAGTDLRKKWFGEPR